MEVVQSVTITRIASAVDDYHWQLYVSTLLRILKALEYSRTLAKDTRHFKLCCLAFSVCTANSNVAEYALEKQRRNCQLIIVALEFHI